MDPSALTTIRYEATDGVATITLDRADRHNAFTSEMCDEMAAVWAHVREDHDVRAVVVTGAGEKAFCTGSDLKKTMPPKDSFASTTFGRAKSDHLLAGLTTDKPLICAINGFAMGGGLELALACDIRIASDNAQFALSEAVSYTHLTLPTNREV